MVILVIAVIPAICGTALALAYKTGKYEGGGQSGFTRPGIRIDIAAGSFHVERILMHETCTAPGHAAFHDLGGFQQGTNAQLAGGIRANGKFSGIYHDGHGGYTKVTGHIDGAHLTVQGSEAGRYKPSGSTTTYSCHASGTFHPKHV